MQSPHECRSKTVATYQLRHAEVCMVEGHVMQCKPIKRFVCNGGRSESNNCLPGRLNPNVKCQHTSVSFVRLASSTWFHLSWPGGRGPAMLEGLSCPAALPDFWLASAAAAKVLTLLDSTGGSMKTLQNHLNSSTRSCMCSVSSDKHDVLTCECECC